MEVEDFNQKEEGETRIRVEDVELCLIGKSFTSFTQAIVRLIRSKR